MVSGEKQNRANKLAANARGNVEAKRLLSSGSGLTGGLLPGNYLHEKPIVDYLQPNEQPHYFFYNESKGVRIGQIREKSGWSGTYRNAMWVTDRAIHFTVGDSDGDFHYRLPYASIHGVEARTGVTKNKFVFDTEEGEARFPTDPSFDVEAAADYVESRLPSAGASADPTAAARTADTSRSRRGSSRSTTGSTGRPTLARIQEMDEYDFEYLVATVWERQGWDTEVSRGSGDRGIDITARKSDPFEQRQYIQAKRYAEGNKVGSDAIQKYSGLYARNESVDAVVVVTTSEFTSEARTVAANRNVKLVDGARLVDLLDRHDVSV